jgi:hypothetical protein
MPFRFRDPRIEQAYILQPSAIVLLKEIAHDDAASLLIGIEANEQGAPDLGKITPAATGCR